MPAGSPLLPQPGQQELTAAQQELFDWLDDYIRHHRHSPSIRQMMEAMGLRSPAPLPLLLLP
ncbi:MAG: repressor LexA, partial [Cyanobium sp.]